MARIRKWLHSKCIIKWIWKQYILPPWKETDTLKRGIEEVENRRKKKQDVVSEVKEFSNYANSILPSKKGISPGFVLGTSS